MKLTIIFIALTLQPTLAAAPPGQALKDFLLGEQIGRCLAVQCQVFRGTILTDAPRSGTTISISVAERIFGVKPGTEVIDVDYSTEPSKPTRTQSRISPWLGIAVTRNSPVTVVLAGSGPRAPRGYMGVRPNSVVFVATDEYSDGIVRLLAREADRIEASPSTISEVVASLSAAPSPALAGYLTFYLDTREIATDVDLECTLLSQMIGSESVPGEALISVLTPLVVEYPRISRGSQVTVLNRMTSAGQTADAGTAKVLFDSLARVARFDHSAAATIEPVALKGMVSNYRALVKQMSIARNVAFESALGIAP